VPVELRPATSADAADVATVHIKSRKTFLPYLPTVHTDDEIRHWIATSALREQAMTVAVDDSRVVGILGTQRADGVSWIWQLYLLPSHVGRGIGSRLLTEALACLPRPVRLWCFQQNAGARRFYERHGFQPVKFTDGRDNEERTPDVLYELA